MKLLSLPQAPTRLQAIFFRSSRLGPAVLLLFSLAVIGAAVYSYSTGKAPLVVMLIIDFAGLLFTLFSLGMLVRSFQTTNWLLALGSDRLWIKYRSYLNSHFPPDDLQIIELPYAEIESVCLIRRKEIVYGSRNRTQTRFFKHLDVVLHQPFGSQLPEALLAERNAKAPLKRGCKSRSLDYPVCAKGQNIIRVRINDIRPGWKRALSELEHNGVSVTPEKRESEDFTQPLEDKRQMEDQLIRLVEQGRTIAAVKLARQRYGMGLSEAKQFIDELSAR